MNPNWSARVVSIEMTMTCRGGRPPSSEQAESVEARARVVKAVVKVRGMREGDPESMTPKILL